MVHRPRSRPALLALGLLLHLSLANAFCVYNDADSAITAYQLPLSPKSFKAVIQPGESSCCHWSDCGEQSEHGSGRCDPALFCMKYGEDDTDAVTTDQILEDVTGALFKVFATAAGLATSLLTANPFAGAFVGFGAGFALSEADKQIQDMMDQLSCAALVKTYNGGIAYADANGKFAGAWGNGYVDPPEGTEDCPIAGQNPTASHLASLQLPGPEGPSPPPVEEPSELAEEVIQLNEYSEEVVQVNDDYSHSEEVVQVNDGDYNEEVVQVNGDYDSAPSPPSRLPPKLA